MRAFHLAALLLVSLVGANAHQTMLLVDNVQGNYLNIGEEQLTVDAPTLSALTSAIAGLMPPSQIDEAASRTIGRVVKPSPLKKPQAHLVLNVAGLSRDALLDVFNGRSQVEIRMEGDAEGVTLQSLASLAAANPEVSVTMLDSKGLKNCAGNCIDEHMHAAAGCMNAKHSHSAVTFQSGASLDLTKVADKIFAAEVASLYSGLKAQREQPEDSDDLHMLEATLVGLQALEMTYGDDSEVAIAASNALKDMLRWSVSELDSKYGGDITYQVAALPTSSSEKKTVADIMGWKQESRRKLASATEAVATPSTYPGTAADQVLSAKRFAEKACAYGGFILLLYFSLAAVWCMCFMPFKQDTMLFGAKKAD